MKQLMAILGILAALIFLSGCQEGDTGSYSEMLLSGGGVYTDWSGLTAYEPEPARYTRFPGACGPLSARGDYGPLLPYVGAEMAVEGYIVDTLPLYGLVTKDGQVVTDPIYSGAYSIGSFLLLETGELGGGEEQFSYTAAAKDGRWVRQAGLCDGFFLLDNSHLVLAKLDGGVLVLDDQGDTAAEFHREQFVEYLGEDYFWNWDGGPDLRSVGGGVLAVWEYDPSSADYARYPCCLDTRTGEVLDALPADWAPESAEPYTQTPDFPGYLYAEPVSDLITGELSYIAFPERQAGADNPVYDLMDENGNLVLSGCFSLSGLMWQPYLADGLLGTIQDGAFTYRDLSTGEAVFRYPLRTNSD